MFENFRNFRKTSSVKIDGTPTHDQKLGQYITNHDMPTNANRRERTTNRVLIIVAGIGWLLASIEAITVMEMLPLYKVVPFFVTFSDKEDQVVRIEPPSGTIPSIELLTEQNIRDYIKWRNSIDSDPQHTIDVWGTRIRLMSSEEVYGNFLSETQPVYDSIRAGNLTRQVVIKSLLKQEQGLYQIEFETWDHRQGTGLSDTSDTQSTWVAQMRIAYRPQNVAFSQRFVNPLGFVVIEYSVARKRQ